MVRCWRSGCCSMRWGYGNDFTGIRRTIWISLDGSEQIHIPKFRTPSLNAPAHVGLMSVTTTPLCAWFAHHSAFSYNVYVHHSYLLRLFHAESLNLPSMSNSPCLTAPAPPASQPASASQSKKPYPTRPSYLSQTQNSPETPHTATVPYPDLTP
jgi:hypothetical protein